MPWNYEKSHGNIISPAATREYTVHDRGTHYSGGMEWGAKPTNEEKRMNYIETINYKCKIIAYISDRCALENISKICLSSALEIPK